MTNDNFADAIAIPSIPYTSLEVDNTGFTVEAGEPAEFYFSAAQPGNDRSAWWYFDCPGDGFLYADTHQSHYLTTEFKPDTTLCVWTGTALDNLVLVGKSDDANGLTTSKHNFAATAGTRYWFQVAMTFTVEFDPDAYYVLNLEGELTTPVPPVACGVSVPEITPDVSQPEVFTPVLVGSGPVWNDGNDATGTVLEYRRSVSPSFIGPSLAIGMLSPYGGTATSIPWVIRASGESSSAAVPVFGVSLYTAPVGDSPFYVEFEIEVPADNTLRTYSGALDDDFLGSQGTDVATVLAAMQAGTVEVAAYGSGVLAESGDEWVRVFTSRLVFFPCPTFAPALRQWPRSDGLGLSSARRVWPPPRSIQRSQRPGPGAHL